MHKYIPYGRQQIKEQDIQAVTAALKSDFLTTGPLIEEFEHKLKTVTDAKHCVAISNGTAALHAACFAIGIEKGDEVITTPITFAASANAVIYCGGTPVFADINPETYNIDPEDVKKKITNKTKAIIAVDYTGKPAPLDELKAICDENNIYLIEDAAHSLGSLYKGQKIGSIADLTTFSFHPVKTITTGEGGAVTTDSDALYTRLQLFRTHGITRDDNLMLKNEGPWYYEQLELGYNYRITDIHCALGISQLDRIYEFKSTRNQFFDYYNEQLINVQGIITPKRADFEDSCYHLYVVQVDEKIYGMNRYDLFMKLREAGVGVNVHYIPVYYHPYYQKLGYKKGLCKEAEAFYERIITLPLYPGLSKCDIDYVVDVIKNK